MPAPRPKTSRRKSETDGASHRDLAYVRGSWHRGGSHGRRGFYGSWPQMGVPAGLALATGMVAIFSSLPDDMFLQWAWRIPFLLSIVLVAVGTYIRLKIMETPAFTRVQETQTVSRVPFMDLVRSFPKQVLLGMGCRYIEGVAFNIYGVFVITYLVTALKLPRTTALLAVTIGSLVMLFFIPAFWVISTAGGNGVLVAIAIIIPFGIVYAAVYGPEAALFSELFDTRVRNRACPDGSHWSSREQRDRCGHRRHTRRQKAVSCRARRVSHPLAGEFKRGRPGDPSRRPIDNSSV